MMVVCRFLLLLVGISLSYVKGIPKRCVVPLHDRKPCGYSGIQEDYCYGINCCYNKTEPPGTPWCYTGSEDKFLTNSILAALAVRGIPRDVIFSLYAEANPGAEWLLAFGNGNIGTERLLQIILGNRLNLPPLYAKVLAGEDIVKVVLEDIGKASGFSTDYLEIFLDGNTEFVLKHALYLLSVENRNPTIPYQVILDLFTGQPLDKSKLVENYILQLLPRGDKFLKEFYTAFLAGKTDEAVQWLYLSKLKDKIPLKGLYPENTGIFVSIVRTQKEYPGYIGPSLLLALAKGEILPGINNEFVSFEDLFGLPAKEYVCAAHSPDLRTTCEKLRGRLFVTSKECIDAGCCVLQATSSGGQSQCFENILGSLGTYLATSVIDQEYILNNVLGGLLLPIEEFIPWIPNNQLPIKYENWLSGVPPGEEGRQDYFIEKYPTAAPLGPSKLRPRFKWKPHGPTAFPFNPKLPFDLLVPTEVPGIVDIYPHQTTTVTPFIGELELIGLNTDCLAVQTKDRVECFPNSEAFATNGASRCVGLDCCYDPDYSDFSVPACFRKVEYGQCDNVPPEERQECGHPGIKAEECLKNVQCCYNTTFSYQNILDHTPWCYYKKRAPLLEKEECSRALTKLPCFSNTNLNAIITKETCVAAGCCYNDYRPLLFDLAIGLEVSEPSCFQPATIDLNPTDPPTPAPITEERCEFADELAPLLREDCGAKSPYECRVAGCCYQPYYLLPGIPWCFKKSIIEI